MAMRLAMYLIKGENSLITFDRTFGLSFCSSVRSGNAMSCMVRPFIWLRSILLRKNCRLPFDEGREVCSMRLTILFRRFEASCGMNPDKCLLSFDALGDILVLRNGPECLKDHIP